MSGPLGDLTALAKFAQRLPGLDTLVVVTRFWSYVKRGRGCWEWQGATLPNGYGQFSLPVRHRNRPQRKVYAHRMAWELHNGPIPEGKLICHKCDNPRCARPSHLFLGTHRDNTHDAIKKGRMRWKRKYESDNCQFGGCDRKRQRGFAWCAGHGKQRDRYGPDGMVPLLPPMSRYREWTDEQRAEHRRRALLGRKRALAVSA